MSHDDFAFEPIRGLPAVLPKGEELLWQGVPDWKALAVSAYHIRKVAIYFLLLVLWRAGIGLNESQAISAVLLSCVWLVGLGCAAVGVLSLLAYLSARYTIYSITSQRVILRFGVAVSMTMNIPFDLLEAAGLRKRPLGTGDIAMSLRKDQRIGYLTTWPYVRPGYIARPQPSFRAVADAAHAAEILRAAMLAHAGSSLIRVDSDSPAPAPVGSRTAAAA
jgi:hypothetical protein